MEPRDNPGLCFCARAFGLVAGPAAVTFDCVPGAVAQLGEHLVCNQGVAGSIPVRSIRHIVPGSYSEFGWGAFLLLGKNSVS